MALTPSPLQGALHRYSSHLVAFEYASNVTDNVSPTGVHTLLFVAGLSDGLYTVPFTIPLARSLPPNWRFVQPLLSSSHAGWGTSSLDKDVQELVQCINYILTLRPSGKIVMIGHSTGCQDIMHYLLSPLGKTEAPRPQLAGGILQAGVSDRESMVMLLPEELYNSSVRLAQSYVNEGRAKDVLPMSATGNFMNVPISARRWLALASPPPAHDGEDDYFSSDLSYDRLKNTFGRIGSTGTHIQFLFGERDQYVPRSVDKKRLVEKWERVIRSGGGVVDNESGIVIGANHNLDNASEEVMQNLVGRVIGFLSRIEEKI
ncbi:hypothetical protein MMC26_001960 [Xylographa opegraphella]|nr:hypothetical protein [Xylographa opegraphella]